MAHDQHGTILEGDAETIKRSRAKFERQTVDQELTDGPDETCSSFYESTLGNAISVTGPGTFMGRARRTLRFEPTVMRGWWFDRADLPDMLPIRVSIGTLWNTTWNIVLCSGPPHNYMRMVEHIVALKVGMGIDNMLVRLDSGDPPLFDRGSLNLVEALEQAGTSYSETPRAYVRVKEPVTVGGANGSFLTFLPPGDESGRLEIDCAVDFRSAIGRQRIRFVVNRSAFRHGAAARTNTSVCRMIYSKTIGKIFADVRNLGYTTKNIVIAGRRRYFNEPGLVHNGKSLEAAWHRAALDLLAAVALIDRGRFEGRIVSYKSGHALDVQMVRLLYQHGLLEERTRR